MKKIILLISLILSTQNIKPNSIVKKMIVTVPVANLLVTPSLKFDDNLHEKVFGNLPLAAHDFLKTLPLENQNPNLDSQLLFGERILCLEEKNNWLKVQILEQYDIDADNNPTYLIGYIYKTQAIEVENFPENNLIVCTHNTKVYSIDGSKELTQLSIGTKLNGKKIDSNWYEINFLNEQFGKINQSSIININDFKNKTKLETRKNIIKTAKSFLGFPYYWGGKSSYKVDCSAYCYLTFLVNGIQIARNAKGQFAMSKKIKSDELQKGDLIFLENPKKSNRIVHVMIYMGEDKIIECNCPLGIRIISSSEKFGKNISEINFGECINDNTIYFGSIIN